MTFSSLSALIHLKTLIRQLLCICHWESPDLRSCLSLPVRQGLLGGAGLRGKSVGRRLTAACFQAASYCRSLAASGERTCDVTLQRGCHPAARLLPCSEAVTLQRGLVVPTVNL